MPKVSDKTPIRKKFLHIRVFEDELKLLKHLASKRKRNISDYVRARLFYYPDETPRYLIQPKVKHEPEVIDLESES